MRKISSTEDVQLTTKVDAVEKQIKEELVSLIFSTKVLL
jgi:hypothetical protein